MTSTSFAALHHRALPFLLPNAWDVPSALAFAAAGFEAVGTTSFGVALSQGRPDGDRATRDANRALADALLGVDVLVSLDIEDGYSDEPAEVAAYVATLPVAGVNLEDSTDGRLVEPGRAAAKVAAVKVARPDLFVNARVDTYWFHQGDTVEATLARAHAYLDAGADGIFVPGATDPDVLRALTAQIAAPVNVLAMPGRTLAELGELGIRRVSTGSLPYRAALHAATDAALAVRDGRPVPAAEGYDVVQERMRGYAAG